MEQESSALKKSSVMNAPPSMTLGMLIPQLSNSVPGDGGKGAKAGWSESITQHSAVIGTLKKSHGQSAPDDPHARG
jgi:hypothetical protein